MDNSSGCTLDPCIFLLFCKERKKSVCVKEKHIHYNYKHKEERNEEEEDEL